MVLQSTRQGNSIFDEMKDRLYKQKLLDSQFAYETSTYDEELAEAIETIEDDYTFNLFKLDEIANLANQPKELQIKFMIQKFYTEKLGVPERTKIETILTTACILNNFGSDVVNLNENDLYLLTCILLNKDHKDRNNYKAIIGGVVELIKSDENPKIKTIK